MNKKITTKKTVSKSSLVKPKVIYKNNLTNILLIILICLALVLVVLTTVNLVSKSNYLKDEISKENNVLGENVIDANFNVTIEEPLDNLEINLNDYYLKESELVNEIVVLEENIDSLKNTYSFAFNDSLIEAYDFFPTVIGDVILEYRDYIIVYNVEEEKVKSIWNIEYIDK
jgi:hypothetical protein